MGGTAGADAGTVIDADGDTVGGSHRVFEDTGSAACWRSLVDGLC